MTQPGWEQDAPGLTELQWDKDHRAQPVVVPDPAQPVTQMKCLNRRDMLPKGLFSSGRWLLEMPPVGS